MTEADVKHEFELFGKVIGKNHEKLEKTALRKLEHDAYMAAAKCTEDNSRNTFEVRNCVKSSFKKVEDAQKIVAEKQAQIGQAINTCQQACENNIALDAPGGLSSVSDSERENIQKRFFSCIIECPRKTVPLVEEAFKKLASDLANLK